MTGEVRDTALDFQIHGKRVFTWERFYQSGRSREDRGLGWGHRHGLDWELRFDVDGVSLEGPEDSARFPMLWSDGDHAVQDGWRFTRIGDRRYRVQRGADPVLEFVRLGPNEASARLERVVEPDGLTHLWYVRLQGERRLAEVRDSRGWVLRLEWKRGHVSAVHASGAFGATTLIRYEYDGAGNLVRGLDAYGHSFVWGYDALNRVVRRADRRGYAFVYRYDARGRCTRAAGEDDVDAVALVYLPDVYETRVRHEANDAQWTYRYDPAGNLQEIEDPYGAIRQFLYDENGRSTGEVDVQGESWTLVRDEAGQVIGKLDPFGYLREPNEDPLDPQVDPFLEPYAAVVAAQEWGESMDQEFEPPKDTVFLATLPETLRSVVWTHAEVGVETEVHDLQGLLLREERTIANGTKRARRYVYDANGNVLRTRDYDGSERRYEYASWNQLVRYTNPLGAEYRLEYSKRDRITRVEDPGGTATEYEWDLNDRLVGIRRHGVVRDRYVHDDAGRFIEHRGGDGERLITYERGPLDALMARRTQEGLEERFERDERGRIVRAESSEPGRSTSALEFEFDHGDHCIRDERDGSGAYHEYVLDRLTKTEVRVEGRRFCTRYEADEHGTTVIEDPTGGLHRIRRLGAGIVVREHPNGTAELSQYDPRGLCLARASTGTSGPWRRRFVRSAEGDLRLREDDRRGRTRYAYDAAHQVVTSQQEGAQVERYAYDPAGNLLSQPGLSGGRVEESSGAFPTVIHEATVSLHPGNRLRAANGDRFEYDARDHLSMREGAWGRLRYVRDAQGRLRRIERTAADRTARTVVMWEADYDPLGRRTHKRVHTDDGVDEWTFYWDSDRLVAESMPDGRRRIYVYPDAGALVPMLAVEYASVDAKATDGAVYVFQSDHRGAIERVEDRSGAVVWEATVRPFGGATIHVGSDFHQPFRLVGQYHDPETDLCCQRFRYWSPELGRFLESDPKGLGGWLNLYAWPGCPLVRSDALGLGCPRCRSLEDDPGAGGAGAKRTRKTGEQKECTCDSVATGGLRSRIKESPTLIREARTTGKGHQKSIDKLNA